MAGVVRAGVAVVAGRDGDHEPGVHRARQGLDEQRTVRRAAAHRQIDDLRPVVDRIVDAPGEIVVVEGAGVLAPTGAGAW